MSKSRDYFEKREEAKLKKALIPLHKLEKDLKREYKKTMDAISKEVAFLMSKYAKDNNLTYDEASKLLNSKEMKEFRYDLKTYIKLIEETSDEKLLLELNTLSMKSRISRLEEIFYQCDKYINELTKTSFDSLQMCFSATVKDNYYTTIYDLHKYIGVGTSFTKVDDKLIKNILSYKWSGFDYSERVWINRGKLKNAIREEITQMIIQGKGLDETAKEFAERTKDFHNKLSKRFDNHYGNCKRLIHTEHSYFMSRASQLAYEETDVEKYEFVATLDKRTSKTCQKLDGKVFKLEEAKVGVNFPPMHVRCRSVTVAYIDDDTSTRFARDSKGKGIEVNSNMTYKEWKKIFNID